MMFDGMTIQSVPDHVIAKLQDGNVAKPSKPETLGRYFFQWLGKFEHTESIRNTIIDEPCKFANLCEES